MNTFLRTLFSTDTKLDALTIYKIYKDRWKLLFLFRDGKQSTGLCDCQARCEGTCEVDGQFVF